MERKMLNVKLNNRIQNTIIWQRTKVTDLSKYVRNVKSKRAGHIARMEGNRWTTRSTEWQIRRAQDHLDLYWEDDNVWRPGVSWTRTANGRESWTLAQGFFPMLPFTLLKP